MIAHRILARLLFVFLAAVLVVPSLARAGLLDVPVVFVSRELGEKSGPGTRTSAIETALSGRLLVLEVDARVRGTGRSLALEISERRFQRPLVARDHKTVLSST